MDCSAAAHYGPLVRADVHRWSAREAVDRLRDPAALDALVDAVAVVIDLRDSDVADPPAAADVLRRAACPVLGIGGGPSTSWPVDLVLEEGAADTGLLGAGAEAAVEVLTTAAAAAPNAAGVLAQVLRVTPSLPVDAALLVESVAYSLLLGGPEFRAWLARREPPKAGRVEGDVVVVRRSGRVLTLTLDRPHVHNAYDAAMRDALVGGLGVALVDGSVDHVVLDANGPSFCSGGDLGEFGAADDLVRAHATRTSRSVAALLHQLRDRVEVRVHGACVGAGVELPAFAGRVVAAPDATFRLPEVGMGALPGAGGTVSLPLRIGPARTLLLALSGITLGVGDARRWGLVDEVRG
jgi:hypothetical protein